MEQKSSNLFDLSLDPLSQRFLSETAKWSRFISIAVFALCGLFFIFYIWASVAGPNWLEDFGVEFSGGFGIREIIVLLVLMALVLIPFIYLYGFASRMQTALRNNDQTSLVAAFSNLKSCYKFIGIFTIVILSGIVLNWGYKIIDYTMGSI